MSAKMCPQISVVSPVYNAEKIVAKLVTELEGVLQEMAVSYEIVLVDDRSPDRAWQEMKRLAGECQYVRCIRLSRNFGQHPAIMAGLKAAKGEWVVVMDCDLQDRPAEIPRLLQKAKEGFQVVQAKRQNRSDSWLKKASSYMFSKVYGFFTDTRYDHEIANFGIYHRKVIESVLMLGDSIKFFPLFVNWVGYEKTTIAVEHGGRAEGKSAYSFGKLIELAFNTIVSFSNKPLKLMVKFGLSISLFAFFIGLYYIFQKITGEIVVIGYASMMVSIWFFSGIIITTIGVVGIYLGKIFDQTKSRPIYVIDEEL
ncbi:MAG TPA: glycosyltransferase family 2 protein [Rhodothermales bacterium]|nr:glycosyltransferase family 2 protein [Rhodothermales bacterium]HRR07820.1 glycosyltransferase family 2 protein [Rhodothermales bacterium]